MVPDRGPQRPGHALNGAGFSDPQPPPTPTPSGHRVGGQCCLRPTIPRPPAVGAARRPAGPPPDCGPDRDPPCVCPRAGDAAAAAGPSFGVGPSRTTGRGPADARRASAGAEGGNGRRRLPRSRGRAGASASALPRIPPHRLRTALIPQAGAARGHRANAMHTAGHAPPPTPATHASRSSRRGQRRKVVNPSRSSVCTRPRASSPKVTNAVPNPGVLQRARNVSKCQCSRSAM